MPTVTRSYAGNPFPDQTVKFTAHESVNAPLNLFISISLDVIAEINLQPGDRVKLYHEVGSQTIRLTEAPDGEGNELVQRGSNKVDVSANKLTGRQIKPRRFVPVKADWKIDGSNIDIAIPDLIQI